MASDLMETDVLSDQQIEWLIQEAEARARAKAGTISAPVEENVLTLSEDTPEIARRKPIPKLKHGLERQSYIQEQHGVAKVKPELLATKEQQTLAEKLKTVETRRKSMKKVSTWFFFRTFSNSMRKTYPKYP